MEIRIENGQEYVSISQQSHLEDLIDRIKNFEKFASLFKFLDRDFFITLLDSLEVSYEEFSTNYYYYNAGKKLHISESEFGEVWISTVGLVAKRKSTRTPAFNACLNQYTVISMLLDKAIETIKNERVYDIDSYSYDLLNKLSPAIFHNLTFYVEVFCKAYLSLTGSEFPHTHKLSLIYSKTEEVMRRNNHHNSLFQVFIIDPLYKLVEHLNTIPTGFKEQFIKYDDNPMDDSAIIFDLQNLTEMVTVLQFSVDFITEYFYSGVNTHYLETNLYQRLLDKAHTEEETNRIRTLYSHLVTQ